MIRIMGVLLWRHRRGRSRGVGQADVIITEQRGITCNKRGEVCVHVREGKHVCERERDKVIV